MNDSEKMTRAAAATDPVRAGRLARGWRNVRDAVGGTQEDFTEGSIGRAIWLLSVPMILEMLMESLFGIVNVFWVARLGEAATAAVGLTESMLAIVFAVALGLSMATTATVARRIGEKNPEAAALAGAQAIMLGIVVAAIVGVIGVVFAPQLLRLMGAEAEVIEQGAGYPRIILGANVVIMLLFLNNAIFRGAGDATTAMRSLWIANAVNLVLDPCFIFGLGPFPEWGVTGSAVATTIGRGVGVLFQFWALARASDRIRVRREHVRPDPRLMLHLLRISIGGMFQFFVATASWVALVRIVAVFGSAALAGYTVAIRIFIFTILPSWGMANAAATLVGQNLGAGKPERAERSVWLAGFSNAAFLAVVAVVSITFAEELVGFFGVSPEVLRYGVDCLRYVSYGYVFYAYGMVTVQAFNGAGDTFTPTLINLFCYWLLQIPLAYALALPFGMGAQGVFFAITVSESTLALVSIIAFRRGRWKKTRV